MYFFQKRSKLKSPTALTGCSLWLDPADSATYTLVTGEASVWNDKSANALSFTALSGVRPIYNATGINGRPAFDMNANRRMIVTTDALRTLTNMTVIYVVKPKIVSQTGGASVSTYGIFLGVGQGDADMVQYGGAATGFSNETFAIRRVTASTEGAAIGTGLETHGWKANDNFVFGFTTGSSGTKYYRGASEVVNNKTASGASTSTNFAPGAFSIANQSVTLGGIRNSSASYSANLNAYIGDVIIYNRVLSAAEYAQVVRYLEAKYAIQSVRDADWLLYAGQSNAQAFLGDTTLAPGSYASNVTDNIIHVNATYFDNLTNTTCRSGIANRFGAEIPSSRAILASTGRPVVVSKRAVGGSSLAVSWKATATTGTEFNTFVTELANAKLYAPGYGYNLIPRAFFWMQGEQDATDATQSGNYQTNLTDFVNYYRGVYGSGFAFVAGQIAVNGSGANRATVRAATTAALGALSNCYVVNTDALTLGDTVHFDTNSVIGLGNAFATAALQARNVVA